MCSKHWPCAGRWLHLFIVSLHGLVSVCAPYMCNDPSCSPCNAGPRAKSALTPGQQYHFALIFCYNTTGRAIKHLERPAIRRFHSAKCRGIRSGRVKRPAVKSDTPMPSNTPVGEPRIRCRGTDGICMKWTVTGVILGPKGKSRRHTTATPSSAAGSVYSTVTRDCPRP